MWETWKAKSSKWLRITPSNSLYDRALLWLYFSFLALGLVMVTSSSVHISKGDPFGTAVKEVFFVIFSLIVCFIVTQFPIKWWENHNVKLLFFSFLCLIAVFIFGREIKGAMRWIPLGPINFQPSELAKLAIICYFANFYMRKYDEMRSSGYSFLKPAVVFILFGGVFYYQSDTGSMAIIFVLIFAMLFVLGAKLKQFVVVGILAVVGLGAVIAAASYRQSRLTSFTDPFAYYHNEGYQLANSQMAYGQGEFWGQGLGNSIQKFSYLPEPHTDFIMAIVGEELGFIGILCVIFLLTLITIKGFGIYKESLLMEERFRGFLAFGITSWIFIQGFANLGVSSGLLPTKGLTFPLVSYGGSSLMITTVAVAILLRIDHENRLERIGHAQHRNDRE